MTVTELHYLDPIGGTSRCIYALLLYATLTMHSDECTTVAPFCLMSGVGRKRGSLITQSNRNATKTWPVIAILIKCSVTDRFSIALVITSCFGGLFLGKKYHLQVCNCLLNTLDAFVSWITLNPHTVQKCGLYRVLLKRGTEDRTERKFLKLLE